MDEQQHSRRFGFVTFPNVEAASQLVDTHFPGIQWPVPGGVDTTIEVLIDYSTPSKRPLKRHSDMGPHISKKQPAHSNRLPNRDVDAVNQTRYPCQDCRINYPSEEKLANHLTKSSHKLICNDLSEADPNFLLLPGKSGIEQFKGKGKGVRSCVPRVDRVKSNIYFHLHQKGKQSDSVILLYQPTSNTRENCLIILLILISKT
ncbi:hypothetical protein MJO28_012598 [Puccinia striiformis f. sp. tritici]|uniref:Uncharacterized protein n=1 Tax=Puccinia striiformis f. sp. tritici TaxID=168172 RepID=A0ACC0E1Q4_9BASI|nr:hypothetical protein MJO28_012598 [Puccinia striiformis f. sp. tritici]